jgi:hypothetical protein
MNPIKFEPVLTVATVSGVLVALAALFNVGLSTDTVETIIASVLPIVFAIIGRSQVTPVAKAEAKHR